MVNQDDAFVKRKLSPLKPFVSVPNHKRISTNVIGAPRTPSSPIHQPHPSTAPLLSLIHKPLTNSVCFHITYIARSNQTKASYLLSGIHKALLNLLNSLYQEDIRKRIFTLER
jgi:hypothetical protein